MTISAMTTVTPRLWRGWDDPGLPVGAYIASQFVVGDAGGGAMIVFFDFAGEGEPVSGRFYNIEQITSHHNSAANVGGSMQSSNWESIGPTFLSDRIWATNYTTDGITDTGLSYERLPPMPIFLGKPQPDPDLPSSFSFRIPNVLNQTLTAMIQGYIWEPRSVNVEGGLRRPVEALYG